MGDAGDVKEVVMTEGTVVDVRMKFDENVTVTGTRAKEDGNVLVDDQ